MQMGHFNVGRSVRNNEDAGILTQIRASRIAQSALFIWRTGGNLLMKQSIKRRGVEVCLSHHVTNLILIGGLNPVTSTIYKTEGRVEKLEPRRGGQSSEPGVA